MFCRGRHAHTKASMQPRIVEGWADANIAWAVVPANRIIPRTEPYCSPVHVPTRQRCTSLMPAIEALNARPLLALRLGLN